MSEQIGKKRFEVEGTIRKIQPETGEIKIDDMWYDAESGLVRQAVEHFPVGTVVKASIDNYYTIKSLVKNDPELIG